MLSRIGMLRSSVAANVLRGSSGLGRVVLNGERRWASSSSSTAATASTAAAMRKRAADSRAEEKRYMNRNLSLYYISFAIGVFGVSYASVPLYRMFCQATGFGGSVKSNTSAISFNTPTEDAEIVGDSEPLTIAFSADVNNQLNWSFSPLQSRVELRPGETTLAFYRAKNRTEKPITGVATYNVQPSKAGVYFNKIQCFCFEEQQLRPKEEIDMPVFFFIDPDFLDDPSMVNVKEIVLSYTFFKADDVEEAENDLREQQDAGTK